MTQRRDPEYGVGTVRIEDPAKITAASASALSKRLQEHFSSAGYAPPLLPDVALEVHELSQQADVDVGRVLTVLEKDPLLAARVLRLAQSAAYAPTGGAIQSLRDAIVRVGLRNLREIVWEVSVNMRVFRSKRYAGPMEQVRRHSTACAYLARLVSSFTSIATEYAFLCGLLHDVGLAAGLAALGDDAKLPAPEDDDLLAAVLAKSHEQASRLVATAWKLPADLQIVLGCHHTLLVDGYVHPLAAVVAVAESLGEELGLGVQVGGQGCDQPAAGALERARQALRLDEARLRLLRDQARKLGLAGAASAAGA